MTTTRTGTVNVVPATGAIAIFSVKTLLKAAGWTVPRSSDGTTYNSSGDQITSGASGANGLNNTSAWFVIQEPGGRRQYMFQRGASSLIWTIQFSELAKFTGGTPNATTPATATDAAVLCNSTLFDADGTYRFHTVCDSVAIPGSNVYMFWFAAHTTGQNVCQTLFVADGMRSGTYHPSDASPLVHVCAYATGVGTTSGAIKRNSFGQNTAIAAFASAWMAHGFGGSYVAVGLSRYGTPSVGWPPVVSGVGTYTDGTDGLVEIFVGRFTVHGAPSGPKGTLASMRHTASGRAYPTTINLAVDPYVVIGTVDATFAGETDATAIALPWITGVVPTL